MPTQTFAQSNADAVPEVAFHVKHFEVRGLNPLAEEETQQILNDFVGAHDGLEGLLAAADALESRFQRIGFRFHRVNLPAQTLTGGTVVLEVTEIAVGSIEVRGNKFSDEKTVIAAVPALKVGSAPDTNELSRALLLANEHGSRRTDVRFSLNQDDGTLKGILDVEERDPESWFLTFSNSGSPSTDDYRVTVGYSHQNLFQKDHGLTATYTTSHREPQRVSQFGLNYRLPLYQYGGVLTAYWADSDVSSGQIAGLNVAGAGRFLGLSYKHFFAPRGKYRHTLTATIEDKKFIDNTVPIAAPIGINSRSRPVTLRYDVTYKHSVGVSSGYVTFVQNIASGNDNDIGTYQLRRQSARADWHKMNFGGRFTYAFPKSWLLIGRMDAQIANQALIPGEQFGAGGADSVRGYDPRVVSSDTGGVFGLEVWAPPWDYGIRFLGFADAGYIFNQAALAGEPESHQLSSFGVGARWTYEDSLNVSLDFARVLNSAGNVTRTPNGEFAVNSQGRTKLHFSMLYRF